MTIRRKPQPPMTDADESASPLAFPKGDRHSERANPERIDYRTLTLAKSPPVPDRAFRAWVRQRGCVLKGRVKGHMCRPIIGRSDYTRGKPLIDFAHIPAKKSMSTKGSDLGGGVGICHWFACEQTAIGWPRFEAKYGIDCRQIAKELGEAYGDRWRKKP